MSITAAKVRALLIRLCAAPVVPELRCLDTVIPSAVSVSVGRPIPNHALYHYLTECTACLRVTHSSWERLRNQSITIFAAFVGF
jgi:hypothetical protein